MSIFRHYLRYVNASILVILAGMISFPIIARSLSFRELGLLGYYEALIVFLTSALKFGTQHSALRFYPRFHRRRLVPSRIYYTNYVLIPTIVTLIVTALAMVGIWLWSRSHPSRDVPYLEVTLALGACGALISTWTSVLMAQERSGAASILQVVQRYLALVLVIAAIWWLGGTALNVFMARTIAGIAIAIVALHGLWRMGRYAIRAVRWSELKRSWSYGIPLVFNELLWTALEVTDRIMLRHLGPGLVAVGVLSIGSGLARYVIVLLLSNVKSAFEPVINRVYEQGGREPVVQLKAQVSGILTYVSVVMAVGIGVGGDELFLLFAGDDKAESAPIFQVVSIIFVFYSWLSLIGYGLKLHHRSGTILKTRIAAFGVNILLNLLLIPAMGLWGAVTATGTSFIAAGLLELYLCPRELRVHLGALPWFRALGLGLLFAVAASWLDQVTEWAKLVDLLALATLSLLLYVVPVVLLEPELRRVVGQLRRR